MILSDIKYRRYIFKFNLLFNSSKQSIKQKEIIILSAKDQSGKYHFGEVGPLEGFSKDNINECNDVLDSIFKKNNFIDLNNYQSVIENFIEYPALLFGIEQLLLSSKLQFKNIDLPSKRVNINGIIGLEETQTVVDLVRILIERNFKTVKLKIGSNSFEDDFLMIESIYSKFGDKIKLRLDNNGKWNFSDAELYLNQLKRFNIEYFEQPVNDFNELLELSKLLKVRIAADESIDSFEAAEKIIRSSQIEFLVLKPSIRLGVSNSLRIIELAEQFGKKVIITSAFETAIGRLTLLYLAALTNHDYAHGLNTELVGEERISSKINYNSPVIDFKKESLLPHFSLEF